jgi:diadenosine tetraphosphate (Ap4A) HIT family hydrolase
MSASAAYDPNNVFARLLRGEIPNKTVYEDAHTLAFHDITPQAPVHVLVIPKGAYVDMQDFSENATDAEIVAFNRAIGKVAVMIGCGSDGYRAISNVGAHGQQEVPHLHVHILGGRPLGTMLVTPELGA